MFAITLSDYSLRSPSDLVVHHQVIAEKIVWLAVSAKFLSKRASKKHEVFFFALVV